MPNRQIVISARRLPIAPRKLRLVVGNLKGMTAERAILETRFLNQKAAGLANKALKQAVDAAKDFHLGAAELKVASVAVDGGTAIRRRMIGSRGRSSSIKKQRSHLTIKLAPIEASIVTPKRIVRPRLKQDSALASLARDDDKNNVEEVK